MIRGSVLNGVLWVLGTGAQWRELPEKYPPYQTCHRRIQQWIRSGKLEEALKRLARLLHEQGRLNLEEAFMDTTFARHRRTKRMREQAWLFMVILQDCGMRPDEVFPMRVENIYWNQNCIWIPEGKTEKARRFVAMSERMKEMLTS